MTPIEKNIRVVDENGRQYEATWAKRARGLVKKGRARFISDDSICLARPPELELTEETSMTDTNAKNTTVEIPAVTPAEMASELSITYILTQIEKIRVQDDYLKNAIVELGRMDNGEPGMTDGTVAPGVAKAQAIADVVKCRETTNQELIRFYTKVYDDLKPTSPHPKQALIERMMELAASSGAEGKAMLEQVNSMLDTLRHI